jgi:hypothetical protein
MIPIFNIGLSYYVEDMLVFIFSLLSMIKIVYEIYKVEHEEEYEKRIRPQ